MPNSQPPEFLTTQFFLAAKQAEIESLEVLASTCGVVSAVTSLIHELQRERGVTNVFLVSQGERFINSQREQVDKTNVAEDYFRDLLKRLYLVENANNPSARLLNNIAIVFQGLDELHSVRDQVLSLSVAPESMTEVFCRLIAGLLSIIFEAADSAGEPEISRALVALFNFMQIKEYAGQERAWGAIGFGRGQFDPDLQDKLKGFASAQQRAAEIFLTHTDSNFADQWQQLSKAPDTLELIKLRQLLNKLHESDAISTDISEVWYELTTTRINGMQAIENQLIEHLLSCSQQQIAIAKDRRNEQQKTLLGADVSSLSTLLDSQSGRPDTPMNHLLYDLVQEQSERLQAMSAELEKTRETLNERKLMDRAKALLIKNLHLTEEEAHRRIQRKAMESNVPLGQVCALLVEAAQKPPHKS